MFRNNRVTKTKQLKRKIVCKGEGPKPKKIRMTKVEENLDNVAYESVCDSRINGANDDKEVQGKLSEIKKYSEVKLGSLVGRVL